MNHVMLDLETLGVGSDACILSIGAVRFDPYTGKVREELYMPVSDRTGKIDLDTVKWWSKQDQGVFREAFVGCDDSLASPRVVIDAFIKFCGAYQYDPDDLVVGDDTHSDPFYVPGPTHLPPANYLWSNAPTFDETILRSFFSRYGVANKFPIHFRGSRDYRTMLALARDAGYEQPVYPQGGHNALVDAKYQAAVLCGVFKFLQLKKV
jgi:hypothetical protein